MNFLSLGFAFILIWILNWGYILIQVFKYGENADDENSLTENFIKNTPVERLEFMRQIAESNKVLFWLSAICFLVHIVY